MESKLKFEIKPLPSNRRQGPRVFFHAPIRFVPVQKSSSPLQRVLSQNASHRGLQILSSTIVPVGSSIEMYVPVGQNKLIPALGKIVWSEVEFTIADSPYWIRSGLEIELLGSGDQKAYQNFVEARSQNPAM